MAVKEGRAIFLQMGVKKGENAWNQNIFNVFNNQHIFVSRKNAKNPSMRRFAPPKHKTVPVRTKIYYIWRAVQ